MATAIAIHSTKRPSTADMQVTSIRLEPELKERLRDLSGDLGYQTLIREILWNYVNQRSPLSESEFDRSSIQATMAATAQQDERCVLTGKVIQSQQPMLLGWTTTGNFVPLSPESLD
jgi:predicted transcriptional regulator